MFRPHVLHKKIDLTIYPIRDPRYVAKQGVQFTSGDFHGNFAKVFWLLIFLGYVELKNGIEDFEKVVQIYYIPIEEWKQGEHDAINKIFAQATFTPYFLRSMGDDSGDRGKLDTYTFYQYAQLAWLHIICSNHGMEVVCCFELGLRYDQRFGIIDEQRTSLTNVQKMIDQGIITRKHFEELVVKHYLANLRLIDYSVANDKTLTFYGHAPFDEVAIEKLAKELGVAFEWTTPDLKIKTCNAINQAFENLKKQKKIHTLYIEKKNDYCHLREETMFVFFMWNRMREILHLYNNNLNKNLLVPQDRFVNGHDSSYKDEMRENVYELNSEIGKETISSAYGEFPILFSYESHKNELSPIVVNLTKRLLDLKQSVINNNRILECLLAFGMAKEEFIETIFNYKFIFSEYRVEALELLLNESQKTTSLFTEIFYSKNDNNENKIDLKLFKKFMANLRYDKHYPMLDVFLYLSKNQVLTKSIATKIISHAYVVSDEDYFDIYFDYLLICDYEKALIEKNILKAIENCENSKSLQNVCDTLNQNRFMDGILSRSLSREEGWLIKNLIIAFLPWNDYEESGIVGEANSDNKISEETKTRYQDAKIRYKAHIEEHVETFINFFEQLKKKDNNIIEYFAKILHKYPQYESVIFNYLYLKKENYLFLLKKIFLKEMDEFFFKKYLLMTADRCRQIIDFISSLKIVNIECISPILVMKTGFTEAIQFLYELETITADKDLLDSLFNYPSLMKLFVFIITYMVPDNDYDLTRENMMQDEAIVSCMITTLKAFLNLEKINTSVAKLIAESWDGWIDSLNAQNPNHEFSLKDIYNVIVVSSELLTTAASDDFASLFFSSKHFENVIINSILYRQDIIKSVNDAYKTYLQLNNTSAFPVSLMSLFEVPPSNPNTIINQLTETNIVSIDNSLKPYN